MVLAPGTRLGPYEILSAIGAGGMGEVWKARDARLDRLVAIKASLSPFNERVEREARAIAAVNHPHVCSLYDVGPDYLVMEYVEGEPLRGPVPIGQALELAEKETATRLLQIKRGAPKNRRFMKLISDNPGLQKAIRRVEFDATRDKRMAERFAPIRESLLYVCFE